MMNGSGEAYICIPLKPAVKKALQERADHEGRAMMREAARIIEQAVVQDPAPVSEAQA